MTKKKVVVLVLVAITMLNIAAFLIPEVLSGCVCYREGEKFCEGDCCGGETQCDCYDQGTDNCVPVV